MPPDTGTHCDVQRDIPLLTDNSAAPETGQASESPLTHDDLGQTPLPLTAADTTRFGWWLAAVGGRALEVVSGRARSA